MFSGSLTTTSHKMKIDYVRHCPLASIACDYY
jgi:hypothetical protein